VIPLRAHQPLAALQRDTAAHRLVLQNAVQRRAGQGARPVEAFGVELAPPHGLPGRGDELDAVRREGRVDHRLVGADRAQRVHAVVHDREERTDVVPTGGMGLVHDRFVPGELDRHRRDRARDPATSHQYPHFALPVDSACRRL
jgi:hypothetical protein